MTKHNHTFELEREFSFAINLSFSLMLIYVVSEFYPLDAWVLYPQDLHLIFNIITASFIHADILHLVVNVGVIMGVIFMLSRENIVKKPLLDIFIIGIGSNLIVFVFGNPEYAYLGASNIAYGFTAYALIGFLVSKHYLYFLFMIAVIVLLWPGLAIGQSESVSYVSHYSGLLVGLLLYCCRYVIYKKQS